MSTTCTGASGDKRDEYTFAHSQRVAEYSGEIARALDLPRKEIDLIVSAARVHDLGKIAALKNAKVQDFDDIYIDQQTAAHNDALNAFNDYAKNGKDADLALYDGVHFGHRTSRAEEGSVTTEDDQRPGIRQFVDECLSFSGRSRPVGYSSQLAPALASFPQFQRRLFGWVVREADAIELHAPASSPNLIIQASGNSTDSPSDATKPAGTSSSRKNSRFPAGPVSGEATALRSLRPMPRA